MNVRNGFHGQSCSKFPSDREQGFNQVVTEHERNIYALALFLTGSVCDAEEVLSLTFLQLWKESDTEQENTLDSVLVYRTALEEIGESLQMRAYVPLSWTVENDRDDEEHSQEAFLLRAIQRLPFEYAKVFVFHDILQLDIDAIADILSQTEQSCKARLQRARLMVRRSLQRDRGDIKATHNTINLHEQTSNTNDLLV